MRPELPNQIFSWAILELLCWCVTGSVLLTTLAVAYFPRLSCRTFLLFLSLLTLLLVFNASAVSQVLDVRACVCSNTQPKRVSGRVRCRFVICFAEKSLLTRHCLWLSRLGHFLEKLPGFTLETGRSFLHLAALSLSVSAP